MEPVAGTRFGRWTVLEDRERGSQKVLCRCDCGTEKTLYAPNLKSGASQSCGCLKRELLSETMTTHGVGYEDYRYNLWRGIKRRCYSPSRPDYHHYGGRGITMFGPWVKDFAAFAEYIDTTLGPRPEGGSIDRIDNDGDYEPGNLRWASPSEQARNRRRRKSFRASP